MAPRNESLKPFTKVATNTISATPIMSAAEVTAVRPGLRAVFSRASRPPVGEDGIPRPLPRPPDPQKHRQAPPMASTTGPTAPASPLPD